MKVSTSVDLRQWCSPVEKYWPYKVEDFDVKMALQSTKTGLILISREYHQ